MHIYILVTVIVTKHNTLRFYEYHKGLPSPERLSNEQPNSCMVSCFNEVLKNIHETVRRCHAAFLILQRQI